MTRPKFVSTTTLAVVLVFGLLQFGCKTEEPVSSTAGGYTFSRDFDGQRRVLRIDPSDEQSVQCMASSLPASTNASWREALLAPELHLALIDLVFDDARLPSYQADADALAAKGSLVCTPRPSEPDFCYLPQVIITGDVPQVRWRGEGSPLRFGLQPEVPLSDDGQELIDTILVAHAACWDAAN